MCACVFVHDSDMSVVSVAGAAQSTSAAFNSLLSKHAVVFLLFYCEQTSALHTSALFFIWSAFALVTVSPRPKKSDIFYTELPFFYFSFFFNCLV